MLNGGIDEAIAGSTEASVVHPWLPLPPPSTTFFPMWSAIRRGGAGSNDQKQEKECSKTQHFGGGIVWDWDWID